MRALLGLLFAVVLTLTGLSGCGPAVPEEELGEVVFEVPELPGADEPFPYPDADEPPEPGSAAEPGNHRL